MITAAKLRTQTAKDLAAMAKREGVSGWHSMRKDQLIKALLKCAKDEASRQRRKGVNGSANGNGQLRSTNGRFESKEPTPPRDEARLEQIRAKLTQARDLAHKAAAENKVPKTDRLVVMVRDAYWLQAYWELTPRTVERAQAALGKHWHGARPILRLFHVTRNGTTSSARTPLRDIDIHGGVSNWYVDVQDPPRAYQMDIGYISARGKFLSLARSNIVNTAVTKKPNGVDGNWAGVAEDYDRIYAMSGGYGGDGNHSELKDVFERQLRRPMGTPMTTRFGLGADTVGCDRAEFSLEIDAEIVVYGATEPGAHVTLKGEPIRLKKDGTFAMRFALPERRQVLPVVASSGDGAEQRTVVLAVERNTKIMEPVLRDQQDE